MKSNNSLFMYVVLYAVSVWRLDVSVKGQFERFDK